MSRNFLQAKSYATIFNIRVHERIIRDADGDTDFSVSIDLMNFPRLIIRRKNSASDIDNFDDRWINLNYNAGRACYFVAKVTSFVDKSNRTPFRIGIYRVGERFPICNNVSSLTGYLCDMLSESIGKSCTFELSGTFDLTDPGDNLAGHAILKLVLTDLGRQVTTLYALDRNAFLLKNRNDGAEYECTRTTSSDCINNFTIATNDRSFAVLRMSNLIREIAGISLVARNLSLGRLEEKRVRQQVEILEKLTDSEIAKSDKSDGKKSKKKSNKKTKK